MSRIPQKCPTVLERLLFEPEGARHAVQRFDLGIELVSGLLRGCAGCFVLRPIVGLVVTATVEDDLTAVAAGEGVLAFENSALWSDGKRESVLCHFGYGPVQLFGIQWLVCGRFCWRKKHMDLKLVEMAVSPKT